MTRSHPVQGSGLGLRRALMGPLEDQPAAIGFLEVGPETWIDIGGAVGREGGCGTGS